MKKPNGMRLYQAAVKAQAPPRKRKRSKAALRVPPRPTGQTITGAVQSSDRQGY